MAVLGDIIVVGGGCYGSYYVRQLRRARAAGAVRWDRLVVVDRDPGCAIANDGADLDLVVSDWHRFFYDYLATCADDLCMVRSMHTHISNHDPGQLLMNCGTPLYGHPSMGSWVTYGLGSESRELPGFVVLLSNSGQGVDGGSALWSNGFLPSAYRGVTFRGTGDPILHLSKTEARGFP